MSTFADWGRGSASPPLSRREMLESLKADLAKPRPIRPQVILVRNMQEATRIRDAFVRAGE